MRESLRNLALEYEPVPAAHVGELPCRGERAVLNSQKIGDHNENC